MGFLPELTWGGCLSQIPEDDDDELKCIGRFLYTSHFMRIDSH